MASPPKFAPVHAPAGRLIAAKLTPRPGAARFLARPRLHEAVDAARGARLVLVRAPAGFGKTTFLVEHFRWLQGRGVATAWLTLDEGDNDVSRFLTHALAAFQAVDPTLGLIASEVDAASAAPDASGAALDLVHHLSMQTGPFALFLDNFEAVQAPTVMGVVRTLIDALPVGGQLLVGSREVPRLSLGRLRAHGHLTEITQDGLRFSAAESAELLRNGFGLALDAPVLATLQSVTQGWAAALWLAALALRDHRDPVGFVRAFGGSDAAVSDYLLDDVLSRLPDSSRDFLLSVSVLDDLQPELCDALTQRNDSQRMLASLVQAGLFIVPQGPDGRAYRFHPLFQDFLRGELQRVDPNASARLNRRAAEWRLARGQPVVAIEHLTRAGDEFAAARLLHSHAETLLCQGRVLMLTRFLDRLPSVTAPHAPPALKCVHAWALLFTHRYAESALQFDEVEAQRSEDPAIRAHLAVGRAFLLAMTDRFAEALAAWEACKDEVDTLSQPFLHGIRQNSYGCCLIAANRFDESHAVLEDGKASHRLINSAFNETVRVCLEGAAALARGEVHLAVRVCREAMSGVTAHPGQHVPGSTIAAAFLAEACYAAGVHPESQRLLEAYLPLVDEVGAPDQVITSHVILARLASRAGDQAQALDHLETLDRRGRAAGIARLRAAACLERARLAVINGDHRGAAAEIDQAEAFDARDPSGAMSLQASDIEGLAQARLRWAIHAGRAAQSLPALRSAVDRARVQGRLRRMAHLEVLLAIALDEIGESAAARGLMHELLTRLDRAALATILEDEGPRACALATRASGSAYGVVSDSPPKTATELSEPTGLSVESLTAAERRILGLLAEGHANRMIASRLFLSESTVKTHLRHINAKLGAGNRTHAVAIARRLGLIAERPGVLETSDGFR